MGAKCCSIEEGGETSGIAAPAPSRAAGGELFKGDSGCCGSSIQNGDFDRETTADSSGKFPDSKSSGKSSIRSTSTRASSPSASSSPSRAGSKTNSRGPSPKRAASPKKVASPKKADKSAGKDSPSKAETAAGSDSEASSSDNDKTSDSDKDSLWHCELQLQDWDSVLLIACYAGETEMVKECFKNDCFPDVMDRHKFPAGHHAAMSGNLETLTVIHNEDKHHFYKEYFSDAVTMENMTPLMMILRQGNLDIIDFVMNTIGAVLKLKGERFGKKDVRDPYGFMRPMHEWLEFVPEISHPTQVSKRRPLFLTARNLDLNKPITEEYYLEQRMNRNKVRNIVREIVGKYHEVHGCTAGGLGGNASENSSPKSPQKKRGAFLMTGLPAAADSARDAGNNAAPAGQLLPEYDVEATVISASVHQASPTKKRGSIVDPPKDENDAVVWMCGQPGCEKVHTTELAASGVITCESCHNVNFVRATPEAVPEDDDSEEASDDGEGEVWGNEGEEFNDEKTTKKYTKMLASSVIASIGAHGLRGIARHVNLKKFPVDEIVFTRQNAIENIYILESGSVQLNSGKGANEDLNLPEWREGDPHVPCPILDLTAYMVEEHAELLHAATCTVMTKNTKMFIVAKDDVLNYGGCTHISELVQKACAASVLKAVPLFKAAFSPAELFELAEKAMVHKTFMGGEFLVREGGFFKAVILVQEGTVEVFDTKARKVQIIHVSPEEQEVTPGECWMPIYVIGVRLLLYDVPSPHNVRCRGTTVCWIMDQERAAPCMRETTLLNHMQIGTYIMYIRRVVMFRKLKTDDPRLRKLIINSDFIEAWLGENIITQGDAADGLFIMMDGAVAVEINGNVVAKREADLDNDQVHFFGECSLIDQYPRAASIKVTSDCATAMKVDVAAVNSAFGSIDELLACQGLDADRILQLSRNKATSKKGTKKAESANVEAKSKKGDKWEKKAGIQTANFKTKDGKKKQ